MLDAERASAGTGLCGGSLMLLYRVAVPISRYAVMPFSFWDDVKASCLPCPAQVLPMLPRQTNYKEAARLAITVAQVSKKRPAFYSCHD